MDLKLNIIQKELLLLLLLIKEVYRMNEIRELESKKLVERQERIVENYY